MKGLPGIMTGHKCLNLWDVRCLNDRNSVSSYIIQLHLRPRGSTVTGEKGYCTNNIVLKIHVQPSHKKTEKDKRENIVVSQLNTPGASGEVVGRHLKLFVLRPIDIDDRP